LPDYKIFSFLFWR